MTSVNLITTTSRAWPTLLTNMLVNYSDSESDSGDQKPERSPQRSSIPRKTGLSALLPKPKGSQKTAQDGDIVATGPKKFIVNLPNFDTQGDDADGPPAKKIRTGGGGSGLSAMLPAPKRSGATARTDPKPSPSLVEHRPDGESDEAVKEPAPTGRTISGATIFVPQSVTRKPIQPASAFKKSSGTGAVKPRSQVPTKTKVSLFGAGTNSSASNKSNKKTASSGEYKPIMVSAAKPASRPWDAGGNEGDPYGSVEDDAPAIAADGETSYQAQTGHGGAPEDLDAIARQAGLDDSAMRQLYGRRGRQDAPINISTFSVDEEYNNNELKRSLGLVEEVKPVRSIAPGKHQLSSLLNAAQAQRGALEESFAQGKRNKKEAGSKYGW